MTSAETRSSWRRTSYWALRCCTLACSICCSRRKPLKIGSEKDADRLYGLRVKSNGYLPWESRMACSAAEENSIAWHPARLLSRPILARTSSLRMQEKRCESALALPCWMRASVSV